MDPRSFPAQLQVWLEDPEVEELVILDDGTVWVRDQNGSQAHTLDDPDGVRRFLSLRCSGPAQGPDRIGIDMVRVGGRRVFRVIPPLTANLDMATLQRRGHLLPEVRACLEDAIAGGLSLLIASPSTGTRGPLMSALVNGWRGRGWVWHQITGPAPIGVQTIPPDVVVADHPSRQTWAGLWSLPSPLVVRVRATSAGQALRLAAAWTAHEGTSLEVARELVASRIDLLLEQDAAGRARSIWRMRSPEVADVDFVAGTRPRIRQSSPPVAAPSAPSSVVDLHPAALPREHSGVQIDLSDPNASIDPEDLVSSSMLARLPPASTVDDTPDLPPRGPTVTSGPPDEAEPSDSEDATGSLNVTDEPVGSGEEDGGFSEERTPSASLFDS